MCRTGHILLLGALSASCASASGQKVYQAPTMTAPGSQAQLVVLLEEYARHQGWAVVSSDARVGLVVALTPEQNIAGLLMRERWIFNATDGLVVVRKLLEAKFNPGDLEWQSSDNVCTDYGYTVERQHLGSLVMLAHAEVARRR